MTGRTCTEVDDSVPVANRPLAIREPPVIVGVKQRRAPDAARQLDGDAVPGKDERRILLSAERVDHFTRRVLPGADQHERPDDEIARALGEPRRGLMPAGCRRPLRPSRLRGYGAAHQDHGSQGSRHPGGHAPTIRRRLTECTVLSLGVTRWTAWSNSSSRCAAATE